MKRKITRQFFLIGFLMACLAASLFSENSLDVYGTSWPLIITDGVQVFCSNVSTQWMVTLCLTIDIVVFLIWEENGKMFLGNLMLAAMIIFVLFCYVLTYNANMSTQVPVLLVGIVFGKAFLGWTRDWKAKTEGLSERRFAILNSILLLLVCAALIQPGGRTIFHYHGSVRWVGLWGNPNTYGLLMSVGFVIAAAILLQIWCVENGTLKNHLRSMVYFSIAGLCGFGLLKSYSRAAWLGAVLGLGYFVYQLFKANYKNMRGRASLIIWGYTHRNVLCVILSSVVILGFWQFRFSEWSLAQRTFSVTNVNDFSWRNRVTAWNGAVHMMGDRPLLGFGWGNVIEEYNKNYRAPRLAEKDVGSAIHLNDFLMIGTSAGIPALFCFGIYCWLALKIKTENALTSSVMEHSSFLISAICRAGAIVLLVGFWFDSGLFDLAVAPVFWILLELGKHKNFKIVMPTEAPRLERGTDGVLVRAGSIIADTWLYRIALILISLAFIQTTVLVSIPFFSQNNLTVSLGRKWLVPPAAKSDFDFLRTNMDWDGRKLNALLEHANLSSYNRQLVSWKYDDSTYRQYVLKPTIVPKFDGQLEWRRPLWEYFYPCVKLEAEPQAAAGIVLQKLRQRVQVVSGASLNIVEMWQTHTVTPDGFEALNVAALRAVGIPARLGAGENVEFFNSSTWQRPSTNLLTK